MPDVLAMNSLSLSAAQRVLEASITAARAENIAACIAICDPAGDAIITVRMDGAARLTAQIALNKAYTVATFNGMPTDKWWPLLADDPALVHGFTQTPRFVPFAGGVPVRIDGSVVGAVGVSGGSTEQDRAIAQAGADVVGS